MFEGRAERKKRCIAWARNGLIVLPPLGILIAVALWGVDLPYWDQWTLVPLLELQAQGNLRVADLAAPHCEHRLLFPRLIMVGLASISGWNVRWEMFASVTLALGIGAAVYALSRRTLPSRSRRWFLAAASLLLFSPWQSENWTWGWQIQIFLSVLCVVLAVFLLSRPQWQATALAAGLGIVATLSFANALLLWPLGFVLLALPASRSRQALAVWLAGTAAAYALFFSGYRLSAGCGEPSDPANLFDRGVYTLAYLGAPLSGSLRSVALSAVVGLLGVLAGAALFRNLLRERARGGDHRLVGMHPWMTLVGFAAASAMLTSLGRAEYGLEQALSSRYVTISNLMWLGLLGCWLVWSEKKSGPTFRGHRFLLLLATLAAAGLAHGYVSGTRVIVRQSQFQSELREQLLAGDTESSIRHPFLYPDRPYLEQQLHSLCRERLGIFRGQAPRPRCEFRFLNDDPQARASFAHPSGSPVRISSRHGRALGVDLPSGRIPVLSGAFLGDRTVEENVLVGWALLEPTLRSFEELVVCLEERCVYRGSSTRQARPEVVEFFSEPALRLTGFRVRLDADLLEQRERLRVFALRDGVAGEITATGGSPPVGRELSYRLRDEEGRLELRSREPEERGESWPVVVEAVEGQARLIKRGAGRRVRGWTLAEGKPAAEVVVTVNGIATHLPHVLEYRGKAARELGRPELAGAGFSVDLPGAAAAAEAQIRVFAISDAGVAGELPIALAEN